MEMATNSESGQILSSDDLPRILNILSSISFGNVINFGLNLSVSRNKIEGFERRYHGNMGDCLREILNERLRQEPPLVWVDIATALRSPCVGEQLLAKQIESQCMTKCQLTSSVQYPDRPEVASVPQKDRIDLSNSLTSSCSSKDAVSSVRSSITLASSYVDTFTDYVKTIYRESEVERDTSVVKWPPTPSKVYINLACIDRQSVSVRSKKYDEVTEAMVRDGNVDAIFNVTKGPIDFSEIAKNISFATNKKRLIIVEGAPGVGKSTFAWEYCRRWERGEIAQQFQLVLLLRLRDERVRNAESLEDLIYHPLKDVPQAICRELVVSPNFHALIILEGYDELPEVCRMGESLFNDLIAGKLLPLATILVTSRPWATEMIRLKHGDRLSQHIEILGFTSSQITEYMESILPQDRVSELKAYLDSHPQIRAGMYIPLNSAIVLTVYEESQAIGCDMPTTLTELYTSLTQTLLFRYLRGNPESKTIGWSLKDLPPPVNTKFNKLCELAYSGTVGTSDEVQLIFRDLPSDFDDLGFMDSVTELYVTRGAVSSYNFLHLTFQEFFTAVHISNMPISQQAEHFRRHKEGRYKVVLRFLAGLNKLNFLSEEDIMHTFFMTPSTHKRNRYMLSCDITVGIDIVQWLFEAQSDNVINRVLMQRIIEFRLRSGMLPLDYYSLGYCVSQSQCQWVLGQEKEITEDEMKMLTAGASAAKEPNGRIVELKEVITYPTESLNMLFKQWKNVLLLNRLSLQFPVSCDEIAWPELSSLRALKLVISGKKKWKLDIVLPRLSLESLIISSANNYGDGLVRDDSDAIVEHLKSTQTLKELCILSDTLNESGVEAITATLASNPSIPLEKLDLECGCSFTASSGDSLVQFVTNNTTVQYLSVRNFTFSAHALLVLANVQNSNLQNKSLQNFNLTVTGCREAMELCQLLVEHPDIMRRINCDEITGIGDPEAVALAEALTHSPTLRKINFSNNTIGDVGAKALAKPLFFNSMLTELSLSNNCISDRGVKALAEMLLHNSTLTELNISKNKVSDAGAVALAQALQRNSTLTKLDLSGNNGIGKKATRQLVQSLAVKGSFNYGGLILPNRCETYATKSPHYATMKNRIKFY